MTKPKLTYFDAPVSRGEECRIALAVAGVDFEDVRLKGEEWQKLKPTSPFGSLPFWEEMGQPPLGQSIAILTLIGRRHGLHPKDDFRAAQHEALMQHVEDLRHRINPTLRMADEAAKKAAREALAADYIPAWAAHAEKHIGIGPFIEGEQLNVADIKFYMVLRWIKRGTVDHIPKTVFDAFPRLSKLHDAVEAHPRARAWISKF